MELFVEKFKAEVREYFERLESGLLQLEQEPENYQVINDIFRIMHSMKGSGGMFGFDLLSEVTHDLESLYDLFRSKKQRIDSEVISFTLNSIDRLHNFMVQEPTEEQRLMAEQMKSDTQQQILRLTGNLISSEDVKSFENNTSAQSTKQTTYHISFVPNEKIFINGTNPLYLIDELYALGECNVQVSFDRLPNLAEIDAEKCYTSWDVFIATAENIDTLNDVFIFVADNAQIQIEKVSDGNFIQNETVLAAFMNAQMRQETWDPEEQIIGKPIHTEQSQVQKISEEADLKVNPAAEIPKNAAFVPTTVDSIRVDSRKIDQYMNLVSELITAQSRLEVISSKMKLPELELVTETFEKLCRQLRENAFEMSLIPLQSIEVRFKRLIHDLSKSLNKEVVLVTEGMETELDKNIIEKLIEPLLHIIRNSLDHGIESKTERLEKQKEAIGTISIKASTIGSYVQLEIEDDGAGLDVNKIRGKAIANGILSDQTRLSNEDIFQLIFEPGFSTSESVTDVSGRGVGMDVVRRRVLEMRGSVKLTTEKNRYTRFTIQLPLSLSIVDGLLTTVGDRNYVIPSSVVQKIYHVKHERLKSEFRQVIEIEGVQFPYLNLHEKFYGQKHIPEEQCVVAITYDNQLFGLVVDEVVREYQAVIKPLGRILKGQDVFSGASVLGTGELALVIDTNKMIQKYS
ncbi:MAG TPA: chemotaxis protein CheA [Prolixibacteraceae bacterium]|nr:chemotaxis protein CheA [Prolixibacteraceae bacterium]